MLNQMLWRHFGGILSGMPSIQVKDVPEEVHATLRRRAATAGQSLQEYLLANLIEQAGRPTMEEWVEQVRSRERFDIDIDAMVADIRADRESR